MSCVILRRLRQTCGRSDSHPTGDLLLLVHIQLRSVMCGHAAGTQLKTLMPAAEPFEGKPLGAHDQPRARTAA
jgi:hypothetical protein